MKTGKKLPSKVAHNRPQFFFQYCQPAQNQPKSHFLFHKNVSLCDFYVMTLLLGHFYIIGIGNLDASIKVPVIAAR